MSDLPGSFLSDPMRSRPDLEFHQGQVVTWDTDAGTNQVSVLGKVFDNLPLLTSSTVTAIVPGVTVAILRYKTSFFILGRIVAADDPLVGPYTPVVMYPGFTSLGVPGNGEANRCNVGAPCTWWGVTRVIQPKMWVKGLWGPYGGGTSSTTYTLKLNAIEIGTWTASSFDPNLKGPFTVPDINWVGYTEVTVSSSNFTGSGAYYFDITGVYFTSD